MTPLFDEWLRIAVRRFGLSPVTFWDMPLREWLILLDGTRSPGIDRTDLDSLLTQYPDKGDQNEPD